MSSAPAVSDTDSFVPNRSTAMHLLHEQLALSRCAQRVETAQRNEQHYRLVRALKAQRRAEQAALRARLLLSVL